MLIQTVFFLILVVLTEAKPRHYKSGRSKVLGSSPAELGRFPFSVSLQISHAEFHFCGAGIIKKFYLLTAGHCLSSRHPEDIVAYVGSVYLDEGGTYYDVDELIVHPDYDSFDPYTTPDIGIVKLTDPIILGDFAITVKLPIDVTVGPGDAAVAIGWGDVSYPDGDVPNQLQFLESIITDSEKCGEALDIDITDGQICFGGNGESGKGMCYGDSGSPLVFESKNESYVIGVVSWGNPCALGDPDVYTKISKYIPWIQNIVAN